MKIVSVVGVRKSGKTTTVVALIAELKKRGFRVGSVKNIGCPIFSMDKPGSNTDKHRKAGADVVVAHGHGETDFVYPMTLGMNEIFKRLEGTVDILVCEGDYESAVPRIVCGWNEKETLERINSHTFVISGVIAAQMESVGGIATIDGTTDIEKLADAVLENVKEETLPVELEYTHLAHQIICKGCHGEKKKDCDLLE